MKQLQGEWDLVKIARNGADVTKEKKGAYFVIEKNQISFKEGGGGNDESVTFELNLKKKPHHIDLFTRQKEMVKGIYKLEKGELTIALNNPGTERPKGFDDK